MKIQLASDLHLEHTTRIFGEDSGLIPHPDAELLVLAGDIDNGMRAIAVFKDWPVPVLYVAGNHEFYGRDITEVRQQLGDQAMGTSVVFLDESTFEFDGVLFLGATFWTDYALNEPSIPAADALAYAQEAMPDHRVIRHADSGFSSTHALCQHQVARKWLASELAKPYCGKTVVITHHGAHRGSVHPRFGKDVRLTPAFCSDQTDLLAHSDLWLHGHVHDSFDYLVGDCRVVANPRGYPKARNQATQLVDCVFENAAFESSKLLEI